MSASARTGRPNPRWTPSPATRRSLAHRLAGVPGDGCCGELAQVRSAVLGRLAGAHHHDGGTALADLLWVLVRHRRPATVVETGVARGVSSAFILDALERNGHGRLWSVDLPPIDPGWRGQTGVAVAPALRHRWTYLRGAARRRLPPLLDEVGDVDIFVHDGLHTERNMLFELRAVWPRLAPGGLIVADDADHNAAVAHFAAETGVPAVLLREPVKLGVVAAFVRP